MLRRLLSWAFMGGSLAGGIYTVLHFGFDPAPIATHFLFPYYAVCVLMQYVWPEQPNRFEPGEVLNDSLHNVALVVITSVQNFLIHALVAATGTGLLFQHGVLPETWAAHHLPLWAQVLVAWLVFDFMFYVTHRMGHEVDFLWRFHSVHHCAHRLSVLNASRAHPVDLVWRRLVPVFVTFQTGVSQEAFILSGVIGSVLATITHMNVRFSFGPLNYLIGSNEIHRWHHSNQIEEARNFSIVMLWDHLFGTFVYPQGRARPERLGLFNEHAYPVHHYLSQMALPWRWRRMKAQQLQQAPAPVHAPVAPTAH
ncbi:sterol desaturase family protein [Aquabacterium sp.]|uniref:sterol desaturase family protein n=1 Tax=Aquabacterium sp. TaxID=1872578 RepID=UPI0025C695CF|nr:sterol desaturase family protein [Aquabacterium sp.]